VGGKMAIRFAVKNDLEQINVLRKEVNDIHVNEKPEFFKAGFSDELRNHIYTIWNDPKQKIVVNEHNGKIYGFAILNCIIQPENPFMYERKFLSIDEFCVDKTCRKTGIATEMILFIRNYAIQKNFNRIELSVWEFNQEALIFYEAKGFSPYLRHMEMII